MSAQETFAIEDTVFTVIRFPTYDETLARLSKKEPELHNLVLEEIQKGDVAQRADLIQGTGGWRKLRIPSPSQGRGKRGGFRLIFLYMTVGLTYYLFEIYSKNEKKDLSPKEKKALKVTAAEIKKWHRKKREGA